jgi:glutathione peroxidase
MPTFPVARRLLACLLPCSALFALSIVPGGAAVAGVLDYSFNPLIPAKPIALKDYAGKVILVVNTASQCGYTPQYEGLEKLYKKYKDKGLVVLGIPANDFGAQEPGSNKDIAQFCEANFGVSFPMTEKLGTAIGQNPFYAQLIKSTGQAPQWNFHKYLIDKSGKVTSYKSGVEPLGKELIAAVEGALAAR